MSKKFDVITFGSAAWDVFAKLGSAATAESEKFINKGICFNVGSKIDLKDLHFFPGGAGTNTAATFANQGFKTAFIGAVGKDIYGQEILKDLRQRGINASFVKKVDSATNYSVIFDYDGGEDRTIFAYRGASEALEAKDIPFKKLKANWFYLASTKLFKEIIGYGFENKIKIAFNPGKAQLKLPEISEIFKKVDILLVNQEEASLLTQIPYKNEEEIFKKLGEMCFGIVIMTKGAQGAVASDGEKIYQINSPRVNVVESTGAGDAFGSGFVSGFIKSNENIESAMQLGIANSVSCIQQIGAKNGLLSKTSKYEEQGVYAS